MKKDLKVLKFPTKSSNLEMILSIDYKTYNKKWSYDLKCVSLKKE